MSLTLENVTLILTTGMRS